MIRTLLCWLALGGTVMALDAPPWVVAVTDAGRINAEGGMGSDRTRICGGAGIVVAPGVVLTLAEALPEGATTAVVVFPGGSRRRAAVTVSGMLSGSISGTAASTVTSARSTALLLRVEGMPAIAAAPLVDLRPLRVGMTAWTAGNSVGSIESDGQVALSRGIISGLDVIPADEPLVLGRGGQILSRYTGPVAELDAAINDGNQGGAVLTDDGQVMGLASMARRRERRLGTMIPIAQLVADVHVKTTVSGRANEPTTALATAAGVIAASVVCVQMERPNGPGNPAGPPRPLRLPDQVPYYERDRLRRMWDAYFHWQQLFYTDQPISALVIGKRELITSRANLHGKAQRGRVLLPSGRSLVCTVIASHQALDLTLLRTEEDLGLPVAALASRHPELGEAIAIIGRHRPDAWTMTTGVISTVDRVMGRRRSSATTSAAAKIAMVSATSGIMQIDAMSNYGNLGGVVIDAQGMIVGMPILLGPDQDFSWGINSGVALATHSRAMTTALPALQAGISDIPKRLRMGITFFPSDDVLKISKVDRGSGAAAAGMRVNDLVLKVNGAEVEDSADIAAIFAKLKAGDTIDVVVNRAGKNLTLTVTLAEMEE